LTGSFKPSGILRTGSFNLNSLTLKSLAISQKF
jgi:hypothetical protein